MRGRTQRLHSAHGMETVPDSRVFFHTASVQRHLHYTVLRRQLLPRGRLHAGQQRGVHHRRPTQAHDEHHGFHIHTAPEPPDDGHDVRGADVRVDGRLRHL